MRTHLRLCREENLRYHVAATIVELRKLLGRARDGLLGLRRDPMNPLASVATERGSGERGGDEY